MPSRPPGGAWIETSLAECIMPPDIGRAPQGARGLKPCPYTLQDRGGRSRPPGGAWIETELLPVFLTVTFGRAPQGARGLKPGNSPGRRP